jgi:MFS family permease
MRSDPHRTAICVLAVCGAFGFIARGLGESFVVFVLPLSESFTWDRASVVSIQSAAMLLGGLFSPLAGRVFDRFGPRTVYALGFGLIGAGLSLAPLAHTVWQFQLCLGAMCGLGGACLGSAPSAAMVSRWFTRRTAVAMGLLWSAGGVGILLVVPLAQLLIDWDGWRGAYRVLGAAALLMMLPALLLPWGRWRLGHPAWAGHRPAAGAAPEGWTLARAARHPGFWGLFAAFFFTSIGMSGVVVQVVAYLVDCGFPRLQAASAWGMSGFLMPIGMIGFGWLDGKIGRRPSVLLSYSLSLTGVILLWLMAAHPSTWLLALFVLVFGSSYGARGPLMSTIAMGLFRGRHTATIFGTISIGAGTGAALGVWLVGLLHDLTGGYNWGFALAFCSLVSATLPFLTVASLKR